MENRKFLKCGFHLKTKAAIFKALSWDQVPMIPADCSDNPVILNSKIQRRNLDADNIRNILNTYLIELLSDLD